MEELQRVMAALDFISDKIGDGMYLDMADNLKRIHDKLNGDKPFHEDTFYYSDDDSELGSEMIATMSIPTRSFRRPRSPRISIEHVSLILRVSEISFWIM